MLTTDLATRTIEIARTQVGVTEHPAGSNRGPEVDQYLQAVGLDPTKGSYPYCAAFVSWCVQQAAKDLGATPLFRRSSRALGLLERNPGLVIAAPVPNCIAVIDHGKGLGHAFLIYALDLSTPGNLHTLEGNSDAAGSRTGGSVVLRNRAVKDCKGFLQIA